LKNYNYNIYFMYKKSAISKFNLNISQDIYINCKHTWTILVIIILMIYTNIKIMALIIILSLR
jgi:hypothetical protein